MANPVGRILGAPADVFGLTRLLAEIAEHTRVMAGFTKHLPSIDREIRAVRKDTDSLPEVAVQMQAVAEAVRVMDGRMAQIEAAMPVLVEVQGHLAKVPDTLTDLDASMRELLESLGGLKERVGTLETSLHPLARVASRFGGKAPESEAGK